MKPSFVFTLALALFVGHSIACERRGVICARGALGKKVCGCDDDNKNLVRPTRCSNAIPLADDTGSMSSCTNRRVSLVSLQDLRWRVQSWKVHVRGGEVMACLVLESVARVLVIWVVIFASPGGYVRIAQQTVITKRSSDVRNSVNNFRCTQRIFCRRLPV